MLAPQHSWLAREPVDMRRGIDTLTKYITDNLHQARQNEAAFVFCNKSHSRVKVLHWDKHGVWLCLRRLRRLHQGHFIWPKQGDITWMLSPAQFDWLIKGIDWVGHRFYLYMIMDVFSRKVVGAEVYEKESGQYAAMLLQRAVWVEKCRGDQLVLHADNGGPMKSFTMQAKLYDLGVMPSHSRPRVSNDNPYSESLFRTLKYCPQWPQGGFSSLDNARKWVHEFVVWYNKQHRHSGLRYVTPDEKHQQRDVEILARRKALYEEARRQNPALWSRETRNWDPVESVSLNPEKERRVA